MDINAAKKLARSLMDQHGLNDLPLTFNRARTSAGHVRFRGMTHPRRKGSPIRYVKGTVQLVELTLSAPIFADFSEESARNTILHEIAHALVGPDHDHDIVWKMKARSIGCEGDRCFSPAEAPQATKGRWMATCAAGHTITGHRAPQVVRSCSKCAPVFRSANIFVWTKDGVEVAMPAKFLASMERVRKNRPEVCEMFTLNGARIQFAEAA